VRIGISASKKTIVGKKKDADWSGIDTRITGIAHSLSIARSRTLNYPLLGTALNATVMIGMTDPIGAITMMIGDLMGRLGGERPFMIGWGADSVYTIGLVIMFNIFPGIKKILKRWQMLGFLMSSYFAGMLIPIVWSQGKIVVLQQGNHNFLHGVQKG
jgi:hypothetical protein